MGRSRLVCMPSARHAVALGSRLRTVDLSLALFVLLSLGLLFDMFAVHFAAARAAAQLLSSLV